MTASNEIIPQMIALWNTYKSAAEIGAIVGLTRGQVIGRIHRFKAKHPELITREEERTRSIRTVKSYHRATKEHTAITPKPKATVMEPDVTKRVSLLDAKSDQCRYPMPDGLCCGEVGFPWCEFHKRRVFSGGISSPHDKAASEEAWKAGAGLRFG